MSPGVLPQGILCTLSSYGPSALAYSKRSAKEQETPESRVVMKPSIPRIFVRVEGVRVIFEIKNLYSRKI